MTMLGFNGGRMIPIFFGGDANAIYYRSFIIMSFVTHLNLSL